MISCRKVANSSTHSSQIEELVIQNGSNVHVSFIEAHIMAPQKDFHLVDQSQLNYDILINSLLFQTSLSTSSSSKDA